MVKNKLKKKNAFGILTYLRTYINDDYAISVLYYELRKVLAEHFFSFKGVPTIIISDRFLPKSVVIDISNKYDTVELSLSLLLSYRLIMLDKNWLKSCKDSYLLLDPYVHYTSAWVTAFSFLIYDSMGDRDFKQIFCMFRKARQKRPFTLEEIASFKENTVRPEEWNLPNHYKTVAKRGMVGSEVIGDSAFLLDDMNEYTIPDSVAYVGDTAFSYCSNLTTLRIEGVKVTFGKFPIIECDSLDKIIVPAGAEDYYKSQLPYYASIIIPENEENYDQQKQPASSSTSIPPKDPVNEDNGINVTPNENRQNPTHRERISQTTVNHLADSTIHVPSFEKNADFPYRVPVSGTVIEKRNGCYLVEFMNGKHTFIPEENWKTRLSIVGKTMTILKTGFDFQKQKTKWKVMDVK